MKVNLRMTSSTPQIDAILDDLTTLCCQALTAGDILDQQRVDELVESLSQNGWKRHSENYPPLATVLEQRVRERCREPAMHRGAEVESLTQKVQRAYDNHSRYQASSPASDSAERDHAARQAHPPRGLD